MVVDPRNAHPTVNALQVLGRRAPGKSMATSAGRGDLGHIELRAGSGGNRHVSGVGIDPAHADHATDVFPDRQNRSPERPAAGEQVTQETQEGIRPEIIAVIAAAIAEYGGTGLRITAVRPINRQESNWARAGRLGLMQSPGNRRK